MIIGSPDHILAGKASSAKGVLRGALFFICANVTQFARINSYEAH
jgi:hypothetical protein